LCWKDHGGSGLNIDWKSVFNLTQDEADLMLEMISDRRKREAQNISKQYNH